MKRLAALFLSFLAGCTGTQASSDSTLLQEVLDGFEFFEEHEALSSCDTVALLLPSDGAAVAQNIEVVVGGDVSSVYKVFISVCDSLTDTDITEPYARKFDISDVAEGPCPVAVTVFCAGGEQKHFTRTVVIDRTPPTLHVFILPENGMLHPRPYEPNTLEVQVLAEDRSEIQRGQITFSGTMVATFSGGKFQTVIDPEKFVSMTQELPLIVPLAVEVADSVGNTARKETSIIITRQRWSYNVEIEDFDLDIASGNAGYVALYSAQFAKFIDPDGQEVASITASDSNETLFSMIGLVEHGGDNGFWVLGLDHQPKPLAANLDFWGNVRCLYPKSAGQTLFSGRKPTYSDAFYFVVSDSIGPALIKVEPDCTEQIVAPQIAFVGKLLLPVEHTAPQTGSFVIYDVSTVAKYAADGTLEWLNDSLDRPILHGWLATQSDVLLVLQESETSQPKYLQVSIVGIGSDGNVKWKFFQQPGQFLQILYAVLSPEKALFLLTVEDHVNYAVTKLDLGGNVLWSYGEKFFSIQNIFLHKSNVVAKGPNKVVLLDAQGNVQMVYSLPADQIDQHIDAAGSDQKDQVFLSIYDSTAAHSKLLVLSEDGTKKATERLEPLFRPERITTNKIGHMMLLGFFQPQDGASAAIRAGLVSFLP